MENNLVVYRASAGSGKTFRLALEYIKLAVTDGYRSTLAMTFTNKATGEMKDRILMQLYNLSRGGLDRGFAEALYGELPRLSPGEVNRRAGEALRALLHDYDHFAVQTIDAFFQSMLTGLAHELGLTRSFRVDLDEKEVAGRAVDRLLLRAGRRGGALAEWVAGYMRGLIDEDKGWKIARQLKDFAQANLFAPVYLRNDEEIRRKLSDPEGWKAFYSLLKEERGRQKARLAESGGRLLRLLDEVGAKNISHGNDWVRGYALRVADADIFGTGQKKFPSDSLLAMMADPDKLVKASDRKKAAAVENARRLHAALCETEERRKDAARFLGACEAMLHNAPRLRLLGAVGDEVEEINRETGRFMLSRTPELFRRMVRKEDASFVFERAGTTFRHLMVDEFQDTSRIQWDNIRQLLLENLSTGGGGMIVGDVKQSIYRWRGGDWSILNGIRGEVPRVEFAPPLVTNRRSLPAVVGFNNLFFRKAAGLTDSVSSDDGGAATRQARQLYTDVEQECPAGKTGGYVRVVCRAEGKAFSLEETMEDLVEQMLLLHREMGVPYSAMTILVRKNKEAAAVARYFASAERGIPVVSDEAYLLCASDAVTLLVCTLRWLCDGTDKLSLCAAAKAYHALRHTADCDWEDIRGRERSVLPAALFEERERLSALPLLELCERLTALYGLGDDGGADGGRVKGQQAYLYSFFDGVQEFLTENASDLRAFAEYWDDTLGKRSIPSDGAAEGVTVMTVHKAKGLAAHTVFIPFCDWELNKASVAGKILWLGTENFDLPYGYLPVFPVTPSPKEVISASLFGPQFRAEREQERIDNLNTLYVAFTRAECNLYLWSSSKGRGGNKSLARLIGAACEDMAGGGALSADDFFLATNDGEAAGGEGNGDAGGNAPKPERLYRAGEPRPYAAREERRTDNPLDIHPEELPVTLHACGTPGLDFVQSNRAKEFLADGDDESERGRYICRGNLLHRVFSAIERADDAPRALHDLSLQGVFAGRAEEESVRKLVAKRLADPVAGGWFDGSWRVMAECAILTRGADGTTRQLRPDRVMTRGDETVVVDFKFGRPRPEHRGQVAAYMALLKEMGLPGVRGYLWYAYSGEVVELPS